MLAEQSYSPPSLEDAYVHCRRIALGRYENFPVASWLLPSELRPHIYAIYAYCRGVDDIGDEAEGDRLALLDEWEAELRRAYEGRPSDIRFVALAETVRRLNVPVEPFERLIEANRRDQRVTRYLSFDELLEYCSYSANPVGHLVLYIFGYRDQARQRLADATCTALQLTNFWQDVREDLERGRVYIPQDDMAAFGCSEDHLVAGRATAQFRRMMAFQVERTRKLFRSGLRLLDQVDGKFRMDLRLFNLGGLAVLDAIEKQGCDVLTSRPRLSKAQKAVLAIRGISRFAYE